MQGRVNEYNHDKGRKKHAKKNCFSLISVVTEIYRLKILNFLPIFGL